MIAVSLRDLMWRRRRFAMVIVVAALAFGLALVMTGIVNQLAREGDNTVELFAADQWIVAAGVSGPFTSTQVLDAGLAGEIADRPGVEAASPILVGRTTLDERDVNIVGYDPASTMLPGKVIEALDAAAGPGAIADSGLGRQVGDTVELGGDSIPIVATVDDTRFFFSAPTVFLPIDDVQRLLFAGQDVASAVVFRGDVAGVPAGVTVLSNDDVGADFDRVIKGTADTIGIVNLLLWMMATGTVAAIVYVGVLERTKDFATLKAVPASNRSLLAGLVAQTAVVSLCSAVLAVLVCQAISPIFSFPVSVPVSAYVQLPVIAMTVGMLASLAGIRKITRIDPTLAFGGAS